MKVKLSWYLHPKPIREPNLQEDKPLPEQGNHISREKVIGKISAKVREKVGQSLRTQATLTLRV